MSTYEAILLSAKLDEDNRDVLVRIDSPKKQAKDSYARVQEVIRQEVTENAKDYDNKSNFGIAEIINTKPQLFIGIAYVPNVIDEEAVQDALAKAKK